MTKGRSTRRQSVAMAAQRRHGDALRSWLEERARDVFRKPEEPEEEAPAGSPRWGRDLGTYRKPLDELQAEYAAASKKKRRLRKELQ